MQLNGRFAPVQHRIGEFIVRPVRTAIQDIAYYNSYGRACIQPYIKRAQHRIPHGPNPKYPERKCTPESNGRERNGEPDTQQPGAHG